MPDRTPEPTVPEGARLSDEEILAKLPRRTIKLVLKVPLVDRELADAATAKAYPVGREDGWISGYAEAVRLTRAEAQEAAAGLVIVMIKLQKGEGLSEGDVEAAYDLYDRWVKNE